jgi:hypothetical protein
MLEPTASSSSWAENNQTANERFDGGHSPSLISYSINSDAGGEPNTEPTAGGKSGPEEPTNAFDSSVLNALRSSSRTLQESGELIEDAHPAVGVPGDPKTVGEVDLGWSQPSPIVEQQARVEEQNHLSGLENPPVLPPRRPTVSLSDAELARQKEKHSETY